jgi:hypothetical protein
MMRFLLVVIAVVGVAGCNKPAAEDCRRAILHMQELLGTASTMRGEGDLEGEVRRCRGGSRREAVACALKAKDRAELSACAFMAARAAP